MPCCSAASYRQSPRSLPSAGEAHPRQAQLVRLLAGCEVETLDDTRARATGTLAGHARTSDIVDANVVEGALRRGDLIVSSDEGDLAAIAAAVGRHIDIDRP